MNKLQYSNLLHIKEASKQGRLVVFVGAGVSNNSEVPTWSKLISEMKDECGAENETDDLRIAQLYKDARGEKEYMDKVKEILKYNKVAPNAIHKSILDLKPCHIITTNYDNLIEQEIEKESKQFDIIKGDVDMPNMSYPNSLIKMHGDFDRNNIVLTESDYYNYARNFPLIRSFVLSLFASKLVVFIGFSFSDLNLKMILNDLHFVLHDSMQRVYLVSDTKPSHIISTYYEKKGINVVYVDEPDITELYSGDDDELNSLENPKGKYLYKVINCILNIDKSTGHDIVSSLYSQLSECKDELAVVGNGLQYFFPIKDRRTFNPHSEGLQLWSPYFKALHEQLKTFAGRRKFVTEHPEINWKELKQLAYNNYLFKIDDVVIVDPNKQYELEVSLGNLSALWYLYHFDFNNLHKRLIYLSSRELTGDSRDLEYPFVLYKLGNYFEAYHIYNQIRKMAWERRKYILYFICLYNLRSIKNGVFATLFMTDIKIAYKIHDKLSGIELDEVLSRLPIPDGIRKTLQDLLSYRALGDTAVETEDKKELIFQQRKSGEKGGCSINSNIVSLLSKFERSFQFCNINFIVCDNNRFYRTVGYNTICGILNSYATPDAELKALGARQTKIDKLFSFCVFVLVFCIEPKNLKEIFRRYEIESIELTEDAIETINKYWNNLTIAKHIPYVDISVFGNYLENLIYVTAKVSNEGIDADNVYRAIIKYWDCIASFKVNDNLLVVLLSSLKPSKERLGSILDIIIGNLEKYDHCDESYKRIAHYMEEYGVTYELNMSRLNEGKYANNIYYIYKVISPSGQEEFSSYCQKNLRQVRDYLDFIVYNNLNILSLDDFKAKLGTIRNNPINYQSHCCWQLAKMRKNEQYETVHSEIDSFSEDYECMKFHLDPSGYEKKEDVNVEWILTMGDYGVPELAKIPEYKKILKQYLIDKRFLNHHLRNKIINVL